MPITKKAALLLIISILCSVCKAQDKPHSEILTAAANALNPVAPVLKFQLQPNYSIFHNGGQQLNLMTRIVIPYDGMLLPFFKSKDKKYSSMIRIEAPVISQTYDSLSEMNATGLGDINVSEVLARKYSWGKLGFGPCFGFPVATQSVLGSEKWTAGLVALAIYNKPKHVMMGLFMYQYFSYAGSSLRPTKNYMTVQPFINYIFNKGYFVMINPVCTFNWEEKNYTIPLALGFGKAFARNLSAYIMPEYIVTGPTKKTWVIQFNLNTMF